MAMTMVNQPVLNQEWDFCLDRKKTTTKRIEIRVCERDIFQTWSWYIIKHMPHDTGSPNCSPVSSGFPVKQTVVLAHLAGWDGEARQVAVGHADPLDQSVQGSFSILPDLVRRSPEDDHRVVICPVQELVWFPDHPEHTGVGNDPQRGVVTYVSLIAQRGGVIHTNHTLR